MPFSCVSLAFPRVHGCYGCSFIDLAAQLGEKNSENPAVFRELFVLQALTSIAGPAHGVHMASDPVCPSIIFCDQVITEQGTGKNTLVGTFNGLASPQFPYKVGRFCVSAIITNLALKEAEVAVAMNIRNPQTGAVVGSFGMPLKLQRPEGLEGLINTITFNFPFMNVVFPAPGNYEVVVLINSDEIQKRVLEIKQRMITPKQP